MTNFQRSYSKVYWGNDDNNFMPQPSYRSYYFPSQSQVGSHNLSNIAEESSKSILGNQHRGSLRSHDSGFNDSDHSPNTTSSSSQISANNESSSSKQQDQNRNSVSPKQNSADNSQILDRSPSVCNESAITPPTVIRKKLSTLLISPAVRKISFSAPNSPDVNKTTKLNDSFRSLDSFMQCMFKDGNKSKNDSTNSNKNSRSTSLRRGKTISPGNNSSYRRRRLLNCVSQVSDSVGDIYMLASKSMSEQQSAEITHNELHHSYESLTELSRSRNDYNNETVTFGCGNESFEAIQAKSPRVRLPLPTYDELYPPNSSSTPKMTKAKLTRNQNLLQHSDHTLSSTTAITSNSHSKRERSKVSVNGEFFDSEFDLSLTATLNWETCTYIDYTNPALNGHSSSAQFWLDETRSTYCHEILSTLQTKSVLFEAARLLKLNPAIASKLIHQIQLKAIDIETNFDGVERVFESHAKLTKKHQHLTNADDNADIEMANNRFKEIVSELMKKLTANVCQFMSKLNSKIIFQKIKGYDDNTNNNDLKRFEQNVKTVIDMSQDLRVACDTKIDDIETNVLLKDLLSLKRSVLKTIRKVFIRLVNIIVMGIEETNNELLLRANINMIATLPAEGVYNSSERFSSLNDAFLACGITRVLLMVCLDSEKTSIRALSLRALATICSSSEMIHRFLEIGGLDVVTDILTDEKRSETKFEPEQREAVSVLTQVTAPWHHNSNQNIDDLLKLSIDNLVTRLTVLLETTECSQTLMLCTACLNNLSRKSALTYYSLMSNCTVHRLVQACDKHQQLPLNAEFITSTVFLYVSIMLYN